MTNTQYQYQYQLHLRNLFTIRFMCILYLLLIIFIPAVNLKLCE